jgi:NAD(P)-dependent dehydrogenase (short-subunit alcohol dehydrogenase family)
MRCSPGLEGTGMGQLVGKVAVVTGAASGIGEACVERFVREGAAVVGVDVTEPVREIDAGGAEAEFAQVDVRDEPGVAALVDRVAEVHGRLDTVVNAAGVAGGGPVHLVDASEWQRVIDVNLTGTFLVAKHAIRRMLAQEPVDGERGSVINIASVEGIEGTEGGSSYNASKGGVVLLTKNLAIDYGHRAIRVNAICPGFIRTPMLEGVFEQPGMEPILEDIIRSHKLRRLGTPQEIASAALFLASADASFVTGHALVVDGGYTAGRSHGVADMLGY